MSFNANVPDASQSPNIFPAQNATNMARLKTIIQHDHKFNNTAQVPDTDGFHKRVSLINQASSPTIPAGANAMMYSLSSTLGTGTSRVEVFSRNSQGASLIGARAYAMFDGRSSNGACTVNSEHNISGVSRTGEGEYRVTFNNTIATNKYATLVTGQAAGGGSNTRISALGSGANFGVAQTTTRVDVQFLNSSGVLSDPVSAAVFVFGG